ncbi:5-formyltetrahydrofolate cyclo-ligase [Candidatus Woesearchaeota archaeon]|nr:5-formyltetrahydrofolate cyclo-ligase [Candidatus Woesearchaeota archaeon]
MKKQEIRERVKEVRSNLPHETALEKSKGVIENLSKLKEFIKAKTIMPYVSLGVEVNTRELIKDELTKKEKKIIVPYIEEDIIKVSQLKDFNDLAAANYGILEPVKKYKHKGDIDLVLVPGVAFDKNGSRVGFGKGYYDKFLKTLKKSLKIALAFEEQIVDFVPCEKHDKPVDMIITEKRIIRCR